MTQLSQLSSGYLSSYSDVTIFILKCQTHAFIFKISAGFRHYKKKLKIEFKKKLFEFFFFWVLQEFLMSLVMQNFALFTMILQLFNKIYNRAYIVLLQLSHNE